MNRTSLRNRSLTKSPSKALMKSMPLATRRRKKPQKNSSPKTEAKSSLKTQAEYSLEVHSQSVLENGPEIADDSQFESSLEVHMNSSLGVNSNSSFEDRPENSPKFQPKAKAKIHAKNLPKAQSTPKSKLIIETKNLPKFKQPTLAENLLKFKATRVKDLPKSRIKEVQIKIVPKSKQTVKPDKLPESQKIVESKNLPKSKSTVESEKTESQKIVEDKNLPKSKPTVEVANLRKSQRQVEGKKLPKSKSTVETDSLPESQKKVQGKNVPKSKSIVETDSLPESQKKIQGKNVPKSKSTVETGSLPESRKKVQNKNLHKSKQIAKAQNLLKPEEKDEGKSLSESQRAAINIKEKRAKVEALEERVLFLQHSLSELKRANKTISEESRDLSLLYTGSKNNKADLYKAQALEANLQKNSDTTEISSELFKFGGFDLIRASADDYVYHLTFGQEKKKENTYMIQILIKDNVPSIGKYVLPPSVNIERLKKEVPMRRDKHIAQLLKTCRRYVLCFNMRQKQYEDMQALAQKQGMCNIQSSMGLTLITIDFLCVKNTLENNRRNLRVTLYYCAKAIRPHTIYVEDMVRTEFEEEEFRDLKKSMRIFKQNDLPTAFEKVWVNAKGPFAWPAEEVNDNDYQDTDGTSSTELPKKRRRSQTVQSKPVKKAKQSKVNKAKTK